MNYLIKLARRWLNQLIFLTSGERGDTFQRFANLLNQIPTSRVEWLAIVAKVVERLLIPYLCQFLHIYEATDLVIVENI